MHEKFLGESGGTIIELDDEEAEEIQEKVASHTKTQDMLKEGATIKEIAERRNLSEATIVGHIETLLERDAKFDISRIRDDFSPTRLKKMMAAFTKVGVLEGGARPLSPVKNILGDDFSFDEIRMARLLLK